MSDIIIGNCINLYYKDGENWERIAHSTTFSLQIEINHKQVKSKDDEDEFYGVHPTNIYWNMSGQSLVVENDDTLFDIMTSGTKLFIGYGIIEEGQLTAPEYGYMGYCWLTDLEIDAPTGDRATYKYKLKGASPLEYGIIQLPDPSAPIVYVDKTTPTLEFDESTSEHEQTPDGDYVLPDLINPLGLPIKYKITKIE